MRPALLLLPVLLAGRSMAADPAPPPAADAAAREPEGLSAEVLSTRAQLLAVKQDWALSEEVFRTALEKDPERADAWRGLGYVLRKEGRPADAVDAYEKAVALAPDDPDGLLGLGESYVAVRRSADAEKLVERLKTLDRRHAATLHHAITTGKPR